MLIKVKKHFNNLNPDEVASFDDDVAADIIARGLGEEFKQSKKANQKATATGGDEEPQQ